PVTACANVMFPAPVLAVVVFPVSVTASLYVCAPEVLIVPFSSVVPVASVVNVLNPDAPFWILPAPPVFTSSENPPPVTACANVMLPAPVLAVVVFPVSVTASLYVCAPELDTVPFSSVVPVASVVNVLNPNEPFWILPAPPVVTSSENPPPLTACANVMFPAPVLPVVVFPVSVTASLYVCAPELDTVPFSSVVPVASVVNIVNPNEP